MHNNKHMGKDMNKITTRIALLMAAMSLAAVAAFAADTPPAAQPDPLFDTISALDGAVFDAFNKCSAPDQLKIHASYFAPDVEFYHDKGGVTWTRQDMLANTAKYACGNYRRELVPGSLKVYPIKDYGAIEQGVHRFCQIKSGACEGMADFVIIWTNQGDEWKITRVLSYGHRPNPVPAL
jgi:hypothetical protein